MESHGLVVDSPAISHRQTNGHTRPEDVTNERPRRDLFRCGEPSPDMLKFYFVDSTTHHPCQGRDLLAMVVTS
jgi:hypothetical protein